MTDVKSLKELGIPIRIDGSTRFVKGATKYTTCGDIIKMVLKKTGIQKEYRHLFCIYETTKDEERALSCKTRILGEMKGWTGDNNRFVLRKIDPIGQRPNISSKETESRNQKKIVRVISSDNRIQIESSGSDSSDTSFEEFLSKVDHTKLINFMKMFKVITANEAHQVAEDDETKPKDAPSVPTRPQTGSKLHPNRKKVQQSQTRRKIKHSRRSRSSNNIHDRHPNKIHRVDYGYVDRVPRTQSRGSSVMMTRDDVKRVPLVNRDSVADFLKAQVNVEENYSRREKEKKNKNKRGARRMLHFTKNLLTGKRKSDDLSTQEKQEVRLPEKITEDLLRNVNNDCRRTGRYEVLDDCREIWDDRMRQEVDSAHDDSSDVSSNHYPIPPHSVDDSTSSDMSICADFITESDAYQNDFPATKLVDYSISSDDETDNESDKSYEDGVLNSCISDPSEFDSPTNSGDSNYYGGDDTNMAAYIRNVFSRKPWCDEDEAMDSFMKSKIYEDSSDEGVSSLESGLNNVHL